MERIESGAAPQANSLAADPELMGEFIVEAREHLATIEMQALALEHDPANQDAIHAIFRAFHTIKGLAGFLDLAAMQAVAHEVETILDLARTGQLNLHAAVIDGILESKDFLGMQTSGIEAAMRGGKAADSSGQAELIARIQALAPAAGSNAASAPSSPQPPAEQTPEKAGDTVAHKEVIIESAADSLLPKETTPVTTPAPSEARDAADEEAVVSGLRELSRPVAPEPEPESNADRSPVKAEATGAGARRKDVALVKVQTDKLDYLVDMVGEMVIAQSLIRHDPDVAGDSKPRLARNLSQLARITDEVQRTAMSMRMVSIGQLFHKMTRLVRDLCQKTGKQVELELEGADTELDRNIVEELADPLMHMIRNSLDHGIEPREERLKAGKSATGRLLLKAGHQSGYIVLQITDDGRGLDRERILRKAIERGLAAPGIPLSDTEVFNFIFHPGFSTAAQVTDVSGRGVGMDVVRKHIQKLRGRVDIQSVTGAGATFLLKLPLTLAIIDALVAGVGGERYIIPIYAVREMLRPAPDMISTVQGRAEMALVRGSLLPIVRLHQCFHVEPRSANPCECLLIVAENGEKRFCLMVDELLGKQEVVIKTLGEKFQHVEGVAGGAILGDGRVGLILDLERLFGGGRRE